jgi:DNA-binding CsgD family transcriptional regulator/tetratricopeptide (TPR) repeat protein
MAFFVGREDELRRAGRALDAARDGAGSTVLVSGEAGIGKSRLGSEVAARAREAGFEVLLGRSIDLVGTELPYQPVAEALRPLARVGARTAASRLHVFEQTLTLLTDRSAKTPVLLVLEDLHWADTSTLDLVVYLAHHLDDRRVVLLVSYRPDEPSSATRMRRLAAGVCRSGSAVVLELGPLRGAETVALLAARAAAPVPARLADAIVARSEGNPFFAEELLDAGPALPHGLRDLLLQRVARLDRPAQDLLRLAAAAGRDVGYPLLRALAGRPEAELRESLRRAVEHGVLVAEQATGSFRFRHALLAEAIYATILPGELEELHGRLAGELARSAGAAPAELAPHWAAAGRGAEALAASVEAARQAEAVFGLAEALAHLERALAWWHAVPDAAALAGLDLAGLCAWAAHLAGQTGAAARALELGRRAIGLLGDDDPHRAALWQVRLGEYLYGMDDHHAGLAALERAVELAPVSPERAYALGSLAGGLMVAWRHAESLPIAERALALARRFGGGDAEVRALTVLGADLAYLGRADEGIAHLRHALRLAEETGDHLGLERAYVNATDALTMLGRYDESARVGRAGLDATRRYGIDRALLAANQVETLLATGDWDDADRLSAAALRDDPASWSFVVRAGLETGRGDFAAARAHLAAAGGTRHEDHVLAFYDAYVADLDLWERRWQDADRAVRRGLDRTHRPAAAPLRVQLCAAGLRARADLAALARARREAPAGPPGPALISIAREAAGAAIAPAAAGWLAQAEAEHGRIDGAARPDLWCAAADTWERLGRPPLAAYCRWRQAEALGAARTEAAAPLREAHAVAARIGARPLVREIESLAARARLDLTPPDPAPARGLAETLGLTPREAEVLTLVARGCTNREIAAALVISTRTAGVHVSHILSKLGAPNRLEAAAIAHRLSPAG